MSGDGDVGADSSAGSGVAGGGGGGGGGGRGGGGGERGRGGADVSSCSGVTVGEGLCFSRRLRRLLKLKVRAVICLLGDFGFQSFWFVNILCLRGRTGQMVYQRKVDEFDLVAS